MQNSIETSAEAAEADAMPRAHVVHTDPNAPQTPEHQPLPEGLGKKPSSPAAWAYQRLILYVKNFEETLDADHEVAMGFTGGDVGVMRIEGIGFFDPDILTFYGTDQTGARTQLIQHVSQLNVMLRALPKEVSQPKARRIGFQLAAELDESTSCLRAFARHHPVEHAGPLALLSNATCIVRGPTMADEKHEHGSMDIDVQEKTFASFVKISAYSVVAIFVFLILLYGING